MIIVELRFTDEIGKIEDWIVVASVLIINEDYLMAFILDQDIVGKEIIMGKD